MNRKPNQGPYIISGFSPSGEQFIKETQTWAYACNIMRELIIANYTNVSVQYA